MPCLNGGLCTDGLASFTCHCTPGFTGVQCQEEVDECASSPCLNDGTCVDLIDLYTCVCPEGFTGM